MKGKSTYFYGGKEVPIPTVEELIRMVHFDYDVAEKIKAYYDKVNNPIGNKENNYVVQSR